MCMMWSVGTAKIATRMSFKKKTAVFVIAATRRKTCSSVISAIRISVSINFNFQKEKIQKQQS